MNNRCLRYVVLFVAALLLTPMVAQKNVQEAKTEAKQKQDAKKEAKKDSKKEAKQNSKKEAKQKQQKPQKSAPKTGQKMNRVTDVNAAVKALEMVMPKYSADDMVPLVDELCNRFKKDPAIYVGAANAFAYKSGVQDTAKAYAYLGKALEINPNYAPAYIMKGDLAWSNDDIDQCKMWYSKAIQVAPTELQGYTKLANMLRKEDDMDSVVTLYKKAKEMIPTFPCNLRLATIFQNSNKMSDLNKAMQYYAEAERDSMVVEDFAAHARLYNMLAGAQDAASDKYVSYKKMLDICVDGMGMYPDSYHLLNIALQASLKGYNQVRTNNELRKPMADAALEYGKRLMDVAENDTLLTVFDLTNYGLALKYNNHFDQAIEYFRKAMDFPKATDDDRTSALKNIASSYKELGEYDKAEAEYDRFIKDKEKKGTLTFYDLNEYASMFIDKADESNGQEKIDAYMKADEIYGKAADKFLEFADYALYRQVSIRAQDELDPDRKNGLFLQPAMKLWNLMKAKGELDETQKARLLRPTIYLGWYYTMTKGGKANINYGKQFWLRAYEIDPTQSTVKTVLTKIYKMKL